jgi:hypothetical protein
VLARWAFQRCHLSVPSLIRLTHIHHSADPPVNRRKRFLVYKCFKERGLSRSNYSPYQKMANDSVLRELLRPHLDRLLDTRLYPKTVCPSEVARALNSADITAASITSWRDAMPEVRKMAAEMRTGGVVEILQKGSVLDGDLGEGLVNVVGPIRLRKTQSEDQTT